MSERIENIRMAIETMHGCKATHEQSVAVVEMFGNETVWKGVVEVFTLKNHPKAKRCYGWSHPEGADDKGERFVTVLEIPPVVSAETAVKAQSWPK
jgi:hypothetical protein